MSHVKLYLQCIFDIGVLLFASLADVDRDIRIAVGSVGIVLSVLTCIKVYQQVKQNALDNKIKKIDLRMKEEEARRYFERKHRHS